MATGTKSRSEVVRTNQTLLIGGRRGSCVWETDGWFAGCEASGREGRGVGGVHDSKRLQRGNSGQGDGESLYTGEGGRLHSARLVTVLTSFPARLREINVLPVRCYTQENTIHHQ